MFINYAHRGASEYEPENTLSAFYAGVNMGANGIETDIQRTKDGVLVLFHDDTLKRVTGAEGGIGDYTYEELLRFTVHNKACDRFDKIPTLETFLTYFGWRDLTFAIELKMDGVAEQTIDLLEQFGVREKVILTSFNPDSIRAAKAYNPRYRVGYLFTENEQDPVGVLRAMGGEEICPEAHTMTPEQTASWHEMGFNVRAWGVYDTDLMAHAVACGADGMTVNFPDKLTAFLQTQNNP